jgi:hypothetical protein
MDKPKAKPFTENGGLHALPNFNFNGQGMDSVIKVSEAMLKAVAEFNQEVARFAERRLKASMDAAQIILRATGPKEAFEAQINFGRDLTEDCAAETAKLMDMGSRIARDSLSIASEAIVKPQANDD